MKRAGILAVAGLAVASVFMAGCNAASDAQKAEGVISAVVNIAQAEETALPPADAAILTPWATLAGTLNTQLESCITTATAAGGKKAAFLGCFNTFSQGLLSASELAQLKVLSAPSQAKVQLIVTAISVGLNIAVEAFGGASQPAPQVAAAEPSMPELRAFAREHGLPTTGY